MEETYGVWLTKVELEAIAYDMRVAKAALGENLMHAGHNSALDQIEVALKNTHEE